MKLDRQVQRELLGKLADAYPKKLTTMEMRDVCDRSIASANLAYLREHGLVTYLEKQVLSGEPIPSNVQITARGIDFLADDGGLSAVLGVVTIKLHQDTLQALLATAIDRAKLPPEEKKTMLDRFRSLSSTGMTALIEQLVSKGVENAPDAIDAIRKSLGY